MENFSVTLKYDFESYFGLMEDERYIKEFNARIFANELDKPAKLIGKLRFKIVYIDEALDADRDLPQVFDVDQYTSRLTTIFYDLDSEDIKEKIQEHYDYQIFGSNICLLERIEVLPLYRGHKIAAKATKDVIFHFGAACGLFVIQAYPLQFEPDTTQEDEWHKQLELNSFPSNEKTAFKQLSNYYKSIGFEQIPGIKELLFYNPAIWNKKMDAIDLEE